jgi:hypothetical protein
VNRPPDCLEVNPGPVATDGQQAAEHRTHAWDDGSILALLSIYGRGHRDHPQYEVTARTMDLDAMYASRREGRTLLATGFGYRLVDGAVRAVCFDFLSTEEQPHLISGLGQD